MTFSVPTFVRLAALVALVSLRLDAQTSYTYELPPDLQAIARSVAATYGATEATAEYYLREAIQLQQNQGLPAPAVFGIAMLESGGFTSELFLNANNPFGIKASAPWQGPTYRMWHDEEMTSFRRYSSGDEAVRDFAALLNQRRWFVDAIQCPSTDYACFLDGLAPTYREPGYSRDPDWGLKVRSLIVRFNLEALSNPWGTGSE